MERKLRDSTKRLNFKEGFGIKMERNRWDSNQNDELLER